MNTMDIDIEWEKRVANLWTTMDDYESEDFVAKIQEAVGELPPHSAVGFFEMACVQDSTGHLELAVPLYRKALDVGLTGIRRRRATIQMSSSLRNLGRAQEAADLLTAELDASSDELDGAVRAFLALTLANLGREREALTHSLTALSHYLPRYNRSLARYAAELTPEF
jgi:tetratricopeptide (TPR) repeat protein